MPIAIALAITALMALAGWSLITWAAGDPGCGEGAFESLRYGYCVEVPGGWVAERAGEQGRVSDRFQRIDAPATITVVAVDLERGQDLGRFEDHVRGFDETGGAIVGETTTTEVDGEPALTFDASIETPDGTTRSREVLVVRDGVAWRITLADEEATFSSSARVLQEFLDSWRFV